MEAVNFSVTYVVIYQSIRCHVPEDMPLNRHHCWEPQNSHTGIVLDIVHCISVINHNADLVRGWWWRNSPITTITKKPRISLTISCSFVFMTATATYLRLPDMVFLPRLSTIRISVHEHHKEINFVTTPSLSPLSSGIWRFSCKTPTCMFVYFNWI